jgi:hypothetical protein
MFESREVVVEKVEWNGEGTVHFKFRDGSMWSGAKRKDFWHPSDNWEKKIKPGSCLRLWLVQSSTVVGFQLEEKKKWINVWCATNNFETKKQREKSERAYNNFIIEDGKKISKFIDEGKSYKEIKKKVKSGHSGNTFAQSLITGIENAENKKNAEKVKEEHNKEWGVENTEGVVNPAIVTIFIKEAK